MNYRGRFWVKKEKREIFLYLVISGEARLIGQRCEAGIKTPFDKLRVNGFGGRGGGSPWIRGRRARHERVRGVGAWRERVEGMQAGHERIRAGTRMGGIRALSVPMRCWLGGCA